MIKNKKYKLNKRLKRQNHACSLAHTYTLEIATK